MTSGCIQGWTNCQGHLAPAPASLFDWGRPSSPQLPFSLCVWISNSTVILLSGGSRSLRVSGGARVRGSGIREESNSYLVTVMGLVIPWSVTLLVVDAYSVFVKRLPHQRRIILIIILGDMVLAYLSLAAACSTASVTDILLDVGGSYCPAKFCGRYQLSAAMAFLSWFLSSASCLFNFWLLPTL